MRKGFAHLLRWAARWLERRGLGDVALTVNARLAEGGDIAAMHHVARRALVRGEFASAVAQLQQAVARTPQDAGLWCTLGAVLRRQSATAAAQQAYARALALRPDFPEVLSNLGEWCLAQAQAGDALTWFDRALASAPGFFEARLNKTAALFELARYEDARAAAEQLIEDEPQRPEAYLNLGNVLVHTGKAKQGIKHYKKALELRPGYPEAHFNLATLLGSRDDLASAIGYLERQLKEGGESVQHLSMLAAAHQAAGHLAEAEDLCRRVLERQPEHLSALVTLGSCLSAGGDAAAALALYERVVAIDDSQSAMASNVLFESNNIATLGRDAVFQRHCQWAQRFEEPLLRSELFPTRDREPQRPLRIGYVSGDFTQHPVGFLLKDILHHHDASKFEVYCFSMVIRPDEVLAELRQAAHAWEDIFFLSDEELAQRISEAQIDILVDLSGHTGHNRLLAFARRPAPVQVEWIGYFHSTGMRSLDYFITDPHTTPRGGGQLFTEIPIYMPHTRFCYGPPPYAPDVAPSPLSLSGTVTFASFNRLAKITDAVAAAWARILLALPNSRLLLKAGALADARAKERLMRRFERLGVDAQRLELRDNSGHSAMLAQYGEVDIALDSFPFNGGMTTLEALWMGVPVLTIAGDTIVSRQTVSALANIGLDAQLAFADVDAYVAGAVALAKDPNRLAELRQQLRPRMAASPLRQSEHFVRDLEALYRTLWQTWCASASGSPERAGAT